MRKETRHTSAHTRNGLWNVVDQNKRLFSFGFLAIECYEDLIQVDDLALQLWKTLAASSKDLQLFGAVLRRFILVFRHCRGPLSSSRVRCAHIIRKLQKNPVRSDNSNETMHQWFQLSAPV